MYKKLFSGVIPPVATIFGKTGEIDFESNKRLADFMIERGVGGLAYLGTTGEFSSLTVDEKCLFMEKMTAYVNHRVPVLAGASDTCLENVLNMAHRFEEYGVDGLLLLPPYFSVYTEEMTAAFFSAVCNATKLPVVLYNFPALTGFNMDVDWVEQLVSKHANIVGIKETIPSVEEITQMAQLRKKHPYFSVLAAYDDQFLETSIRGIADGFVNASGNYAPEPSVKLYRMYREGASLSELERANESVKRAMRIYSVSKPLYLAVKEAIYQRVLHRKCGERLPAVGLDDEQKQQVSKIIANLNI